MITSIPPAEVLALYPAHDYTLNGVFDGRAQTDPARTFLLCGDDTWSWGRFRAAIDAAARILLSRGVRNGDRVAIMAPNSYAHVLLLFATARIGAILVPVNPGFGADEVAYILRHAGVSAVACSATTLAAARQACAEIAPAPWFVLVDGGSGDVPRLDELLNSPDRSSLPPNANADDCCIIIYSSGTTGFPKGVMHSQRSYLLSGEVHVGRTHLQPGGRVLCMLPMFHVNALFYSLGSAIAAGASVVIAPHFSASQFWHTVATTGATHTTVMAGVAAILARRARSEFVPGHRLSVVNGSGFTAETLRTFHEEFGVSTIIEGFGMTEIPATFGNPFAGPHKLGSMGRPTSHPLASGPWTEARVIDDDGRDVADDTAGELAVRVPNVMQGYYRDPVQSADAFHDGWFMTGDLVRRDADGFFHFVGRKKDIIRRRGENISGAELDRVIGAHPAVAEAATIGVPGELGEEEIMAVVATKPGATVTVDEIRQWCAQQLAAHKVPRCVVLVDRLPHTPTHKVAKHVLKKDSGLLDAARAQLARTPHKDEAVKSRAAPGSSPVAGRAATDHKAEH